MRLIHPSEPFASRVRRCAREIALAAVLTILALGLVVAAIYRSAPETAAVIDPASKQESKPN